MERIVAYGSLICPESLALTAPTAKILNKVIVKGFRRQFNIISKKPEFGINVLNAVKDDNSLLNGVTFEISEGELKPLLERESSYSLEEVEVFDFKTGKSLGTAKIFIGRDERIDRENSPPKRKYLKMCRESAYDLGDDFGELFDKTTFMSDSCPLVEWLEKNSLSVS